MHWPPVPTRQPRRKAKPTGRLRFLSETSFDLVALRRHVHLQRLAPVRPEHLPLAHWLFRVHRAPERSLRVVRLGLPRHTPRWQIPEAHCRLDQQRAPDGALAMLGVASSTIRPAPRMRRCSTVPPLLLFTRLVVPLRLHGLFPSQIAGRPEAAIARLNHGSGSWRGRAEVAPSPTLRHTPTPVCRVTAADD